MHKWFLLALVLVVGYFMVVRPTPMPLTRLEYYDQTTPEQQSLKQLSCLKNRCLMIYVAPWCPACRSSNPAFISAVEQLEARGIATFVVIGLDKPEALKAYAANFPFPVYLDQKKTFFKELGASRVPYAAVWEPGGKITTSGSAGFSSDTALIHHFKLDR